MPASYWIDKERSIVIGTATGVVTANDLIAAFDKLMTESQGKAATLPMLFKADERAMHHEMDVASLELVKHKLREWRRSIAFNGRIKSAIVSADPIHDPAARLWQAMADADPAMGVEVRVFPTEEAALAWLPADGRFSQHARR